MTDLSAIRAWFADPHAPNDEACDYVSDLLIEIDRLTAERATLLAPVDGVDVGEMLSDPDRPWLFAPWVDVQARLDVVPTLAREVARLRACIAAAEQTSAKMVSTIEDLRKLWDETKERLTAERTAETHRHEAVVTRLSAVRSALLDETGSAPSITDPPDVWSRAIRAAVCGAKMLAEEAEELRRSEAALLYRPEGGADLGFKVEARLWWKPLDNGSIEIEDFTRLSHPEGAPFRRAHYRNGEALAYSFHATPRAAMRATTP